MKSNFFTKNQHKEIHIVTTNKCFFNCLHCCGQKDNSSLDIQTIKRIINFAKKYKYNIDWGGGEILTLGKDFLKSVVKMFNGTFINTLYSTLHINMDKEYKDIFEHFDRVMISIDSYRLKNPKYNINLIFNNIKQLKNPQKIVSYTPRLEDTEKEYETYYQIAQGINASVFHVGFLYPNEKQTVLQPEKYIEILNYLFELENKYGYPEVAYFSPASIKQTDNFGFRAYSCFKNGIYVSAHKEVACCAADEFAPSHLGIPKTDLDSFLENPDKFYEQNFDYVVNTFIKDIHNDCKKCEYYNLCMAGCPYFRKFSSDNKDIYCDVYKTIFNLFVRRNNGRVSNQTIG